MFHPYEINTTYDQVYFLVVVGLLLPLIQLVGEQLRCQYEILLQCLPLFWIVACSSFIHPFN